MDTLDQMFEFDEVECVMVANDEDLMEEATNDVEVHEVEDEDDDYYDETIANIGATFTMEDLVVNEFRETRDHGMDTLNEDFIDNAIMDINIDPDVEEIEDDEDDEDF